jgi:ribonuclease G
MSKELAISANRHETRVAIIEDDQVAEVYYQREHEYSLAGSIHKGRVTRVLPGMQSAFVDIGLERDAFLYVSDFFEDNEEYDKIVTGVEDKVLKLDRTPPAQAAPVAEPGMEEAPPSAPAPDAVQPSREAVAPQAGPAPMAPRHDDSDRRGRRSRRRRGQKGGGRGLPDSKFYSPVLRIAPEAQPLPEPAAAEPASVDAADFLVLPGESLAKHRLGALREEAAIEPLTPEEELEVEDVFQPPAGAEPEFVEELSDPGPEPAPPEIEPEPVGMEPEPELAEPGPEGAPSESGWPAEAESPAAAAVEEEALPYGRGSVEEEALPYGRGSAEQEPLPDEAPSGPGSESVAESDAETAEDVDLVATDAAEPADAGEPLEALPPMDSQPEGEDPTNPYLGAADDETAEEVPFGDEPEGPEPVRIPTSLTAALREQGPRYPHRVSRRTRRKGRDNRDRFALPGDAARPSGPMAPEVRVQEAAPKPVSESRNAPQGASDGRPDKAPGPSISDLLKEGQEIIVQIAKEPLGHKGARITSHIALPGRFLVYMPTVDHIGVSRKIPSDEERMRLKRILQANRTGISGGYIVRTAGEGRTEEELRADMMFLYNLWLDMRQKAERKPAPMLIHHDLNVVERILRDQLTPAFKSIWTDNEEIYENVLRFVQRFQPALVGRVKMYTRSAPMFDEFGITAEIEKALRPKVWLKSGGHIVINQTEALVAIDVNTGKFVGKSNRLEDTIVKVNTDAIKEIVRQIRLRDLGGIIVVDFIDMDERKNRQKVMQTLEEAMRADRAPYKILQFNDFGLVAITRKRVKQSLERTLCTPCPYCEGSGYIKSPQTIVGEILQEAHKIARAVEGKDVLLRVNPEVAKLLKSNQNTYLQELEEILGRTVIVKSDAQLNQERFDLA